MSKKNKFRWFRFRKPRMEEGIEEKLGTGTIRTQAGAVHLTLNQPEKIVEKIPHYITELLRTPEEEEVHCEQEALYGLDITMARLLCVPSNELIPPMIAEDYKKKTMPKEIVSKTLATIQAQINACQSIRELMRKKITEDEHAYFGPRAPDSQQKLKQAVDAKMLTLSDEFENIDRGLPHLIKIKAVLEEKLQEFDKIELEQSKKLPEVIKEMEKLCHSAEKLHPKIVKANNEYQRNITENNLNKLAFFVQEYQKLVTEFAELQISIHAIQPPPTLPEMKDLPLLPTKIWKLID